MKKNAALEKQKDRKTPKRTKEKRADKEKSQITPPESATVKERLAATGSHLQERLHEVADTAAEGVVKRADRCVQQTSDRVREIEKTGHEAARKLSRDHPEVLTYTIDYLAGRIGGVADYFDERDARDVLQDTRRLVREYPVPTLGAFALLGIAVGRILLAGNNGAEE